MADVVFNIAKGRVNELASLPAANDAMILVLLLAAGLQSDATLIDYDDLGTLLAAANDEATFTGYTRRTLTGVVSNTDDTNDRRETDANDPASYTNTGGASQAIGAALIVYDGDTTSGTDTNITPLVKLDCVVTFDVGVATTLSFNAAGFFRAA